MLLSLVYALLFIPIPAARFSAGLRPARHRDRARVARATRYAALLSPRRSRGHGWVIAVTLCVAASAGCFYLPPRDRLPAEMDEGGYVIDYFTPTGTSLQETDAMLRRVEAVLERHTGGGRVHAAYRHRDGYVRHRAEQRRHRRAA